MRQVLSFIAGVLAFLAIMWAIQGNGFFMFKVFAPKYEQVRRETFEQSKAYRQGMIQELQNMQFEYLKATPEQRQALASVILHRTADVPPDALTPDLNDFISELKNKKEY